MSDSEPDARGFELGRHAGEIDAWCEAVAAGIKPLGLSAPFAPGDCSAILPYMERASQRNGVSFWLEEELCATDLFAGLDMAGRWVFLIYAQRGVLERYLEIKREVAEAQRAGECTGAVRREMARRFGELLGYGDAVLEARLAAIMNPEEERS